MKRHEFLKGIGLAGLSTALPFSKAAARMVEDEAAKTTACVLIPSETEGPFPLDLTTNNAATYFRQDLRENKPGTTLKMKLRVLGLGNCLPMANVRVNIWHCDHAGIYSGYAGGMNQGGSTTTTYMRGYQMTDANGEVEFTTIFPGWYNGRICHIHFQVFVSSIYKAVSQLTFPIAAKNALYAANSSVYTKGADQTTSFAADNIFSDGVTNQTATLTANSDGSYSSFLELAINGNGATGLMNYEGETGGQFKMGQNFPNPYRDVTTVPFSLVGRSDVKLAIYDLNARKVAEIVRTGLAAGGHTIEVSPDALRIPTGNYLYQIQVTNSTGSFRQAKMMTAAR